MSLPFNEKDIPVQATGVVVTDLDALMHNYRRLRDMAAPAECAAVVKANGYGVGASAAARALSGAGCKTFLVATPDEALSLRNALSEAIIYVLDGLLPGSAELFVANNLRPVLDDLDEIAEWSAFCRMLGRKLPAALHIDTGMNRLGLKIADRTKLFDDTTALDSFQLSLIMSHLACGDTPDNPKNENQRTDFQSVLERLPKIPASLSNSAGIFLGTDYHFDLVRPGIALYGGNPYSGRANPMDTVVRLYGRVIQTGAAKTGETIGYGAAFKLKRDTQYAVVAIGYADGYFRSLGSSDERAGAIAYAGGRPAPILGRVSMDLTVFDITDLPLGSVRRGGYLELIGKHFTVDDAAELAGTITYEILTGLSRRCHRVYLGGAAAENA